MPEQPPGWTAMRSLRSSRPSWSRRLFTFSAAPPDRLMPSVRISVLVSTCSVMVACSLSSTWVTTGSMVAHGRLFPSPSPPRGGPRPGHPLGEPRQALGGLGERLLLADDVDHGVRRLDAQRPHLRSEEHTSE